MRVEPSKPRYTVRTEVGAVTFGCPPRRNWFVLLFLIAWLGGWTVAGLTTFREVMRPGDHQAFLSFWLVGWAVGELCVLAVVAWQLAGLEELSVVRGDLIHRVSIAGVGRSREFTGTEVRHLRTTQPLLSAWLDGRSFSPPLFGSGYGAIAFDYGARTYRIGAGLDEAEAQQIVASLSKQLPRMVESAPAR